LQCGIPKVAAAPIHNELLAKISSRIINEVRGIKRVAYDISS
jgi:GMP synthase PP-ATPase subunit